MRRTEDDVRLLWECFAANGAEKDMQVLRWHYLHRPAPGIYTHFALQEGGDGPAVAGIYSLLPAVLRVNGRARPAAQALDVITDARCRGRGVFVGLGAAACGRAEAEGVAVLYAFPNDKSGPGFWNKLGWTRLGSPPFLVRPLRTRFFLSRLPRIGRALARMPDLPLPRPRAASADGGIEPLAEWGAEIDALWERFSAGIGVAVQRDAAFLRWRFADKPGERYEVRVLRRAGRMEGLVVWTLKSKHGGSIGYLMELMHDPARPDDGRALLSAAVRDMAAGGADAVLAWSLPHAPNHAVYRGGGFLPMPERLRPIQLNFGVRALDPALQPLVQDLGSWYLSYSDSDTV
jgi:hypothetical protein